MIDCRNNNNNNDNNNNNNNKPQREGLLKAKQSKASKSQGQVIRVRIASKKQTDKVGRGSEAGRVALPCPTLLYLRLPRMAGYSLFRGYRSLL